MAAIVFSKRRREKRWKIHRLAYNKRSKLSKNVECSEIDEVENGVNFKKGIL
jgi:hypothetical protein